MAATSVKAYKGLAMEGFIATWYTRNTARDLRRFTRVARLVAAQVAPGGRILELAPGPGYLAIEIARTGLHSVTGLDISRSFVRIARDNARNAGVPVDFQHGNAARMPFRAATFDFVVCMAAFKNFSDPVGALDEIHRVLRPNGRAMIHDLRKEASLEDIEKEVRGMRLSAFNAAVTRWIFRHVLLKNAYSAEALARLVAESRFGAGDIDAHGIGFDLRLERTSAQPQPLIA